MRLSTQIEAIQRKSVPGDRLQTDFCSNQLLLQSTTKHRSGLLFNLFFLLDIYMIHFTRFCVCHREMWCVCCSELCIMLAESAVRFSIAVGILRKNIFTFTQKGEIILG